MLTEVNSRKTVPTPYAFVVFHSGSMPTGKRKPSCLAARSTTARSHVSSASYGGSRKRAARHLAQAGTSAQRRSRSIAAASADGSCTGREHAVAEQANAAGTRVRGSSTVPGGGGPSAGSHHSVRLYSAG